MALRAFTPSGARGRGAAAPPGAPGGPGAGLPAAPGAPRHAGARRRNPGRGATRRILQNKKPPVSMDRFLQDSGSARILLNSPPSGLPGA